MSVKKLLHQLELLMGEGLKQQASGATIKLEREASKLLTSHSSKLTKTGRRAAPTRQSSAASCMSPLSELKENPCFTAAAEGWAS